MIVTVRPATGDEDIEAVRRLFSQYARSLPVDLAYQGFEAELETLPGKYAPPAGALFLAIDDNNLATGCVAVRSLTQEICEMKRLYVTDEGRGAGAGRLLAEAAITSARGIGYRQLRLDTLPSMTAAQGLYAALGFASTNAYYDTPVEGTVFMALHL